MNKKEPQVCDVTENLFRTVLMLLRTGGVPIHMKNPSIRTSVYNVLVTLHGYALHLAFFVDSIVHRDDLKRFMKTFRSLIPASLIIWVFLNLR
jgi:hypothetical protein